jgi:nicotinamide mononucleotide (NMN) deamidase PncC
MKSLLPQKIARLAERVVAENKAAGRVIATAESCTGGLVAAAITEVPGSSAVLGSGFVTYSNEAKMKMLDVNSDILDTFGAVSVAVAWAMAQGALKKSGADIAVAISGIEPRKSLSGRSFLPSQKKAKMPRIWLGTKFSSVRTKVAPTSAATQRFTRLDYCSPRHRKGHRRVR